MKVLDGTLLIEEAIGDESIDEFLATVSQDGIEKIEVKTNDLGASIIQALLIQKREKEIIIEDTVLQKVFENVHYKILDL